MQSFFVAIKKFFIALLKFITEINAVYKKNNSVTAVLGYLLKRYKRQIFWTISLLLVILLLVPLFTYLYFAADLKDKESIMNRGKTGLTLLDRKGEVFFTFYQPKKITYVTMDEIPVTVQEAVIAAEDKNFYTNSGFSVSGIGRAFFANILAGRIVEGGSTITQELVKNAFLDSSRSFLRKYQEIVLATELNRRFNKSDILEMYLNSVYFGEGAFGIENAAQAYFGIPAKDLTLEQATLLVGILPAPSVYSPLSNNPEKAMQRRKIVLNQMVAEKYISQEQANDASRSTPEYHPAQAETGNTLAPHFALFVRDTVLKKYGEERIIRDGFQVKTTLNKDWQEYSERTVRNQILYLKGNNASNGAAVVLDPATGQILALVGSYDWNDDKFGTVNMATTPRQPGSSFKPIIYAKALDEHIITPAKILHDDPITYSDGYQPHDYDKKYRGPVTVRRALANSLNIPAIEVMNNVGVNNGLAMAKKLGITTLGTDASKYGLSLVLGAGEVPLLELTNAYATFANQGRYNEPTGILEIKNKYDNVIYETKSDSKKVLGDDVSFLITSILSDNNARAEEFGNALTIARPAAVKTGTTENYRDALTIGYTPTLAIGVWVGNNDNTPMDNIAGSLGAAPIWRQLMGSFLDGTPVKKFEQPSSVVSAIVCPYKNLSNVTANPAPYKEFFAFGTQPNVQCLQISPTPTPSVKPSATPKPTATPRPSSTPTPTKIQPTATKVPTPTQISLIPTATLPITSPTSLTLPTVVGQ